MVAWLNGRLSPSGVRFNFMVTGAVLKSAVLDRRLAVKPCTGVKRPRSARIGWRS